MQGSTLHKVSVPATTFPGLQQPTGRLASDLDDAACMLAEAAQLHATAATCLAHWPAIRERQPLRALQPAGGPRVPRLEVLHVQPELGAVLRAAGCHLRTCDARLVGSSCWS